MGIHSPKNCVEAEVGPSWRAQALLDDSFIQSLLWLLWASPRFSPESHCPPGQARHSPALPFLLRSPAPRERARDRGCGPRAQQGLPPTASHRHVLPKHLLCTLHTGVRHGPRRPYPGCPLLDVLHPPPPSWACVGEGPRSGTTDYCRCICTCTRPQQPFSAWAVWRNTATGLQIPRVQAAWPPRPVQGCPQDPSCSLLACPACCYFSSRPGEPFLFPAMPLGWP